MWEKWLDVLRKAQPLTERPQEVGVDTRSSTADDDWKLNVEAKLKAEWICWIHLTNTRTSPMVVSIEPWGEDYTLLPGETVQMVAIGSSPASYVHLLENGFMAVYAEGDCTEILVYQDGTQLECGHQRQAR